MKDYILENELAYAIYDKYPVGKGHMLFIPKRHVKDFFDITKEERNEIKEKIYKEIDQKLTEYFKTHETLTRNQFEVLCTQVKSTAHRILLKRVKDGKLRNVATSHNPVYMPDNGHYKYVAENQ